MAGPLGRRAHLLGAQPHRRRSAGGFAEVADRRKLYVLDMFPYPSGAGLHVGHPLGYIGTDVYARFMRMRGHNVLHAMGYDAFGLPAEQYAVQTGQHPRVTTEANVANMRRQLRALGLGHDPRRSVATTDVDYYRWTQWIFLQLYDSWYDDDAGPGPPDRRAPRASSRTAAGRPRATANPEAQPWRELDGDTRRAVVDSYRLAYLDEAPVNWCPALGTVLANEEVTADGRSERGNHPVFRRPLKQWMLRITAYADRLLADLDLLDWPESIKLMQRNWIGRSVGAEVAFPVEEHTDVEIDVFTTRPDTLFGATYMVLAPEHPLVDADRPRPVARGLAVRVAGQLRPRQARRPRRSPSYREFAAQKSELERQAEGREKTGVFIGAFAKNPTNGWNIPVFIADYVLMGYGTGAIMAVPAHDQRDFEFARRVRPARSSASCSRPTPGSRARAHARTRRPTSGPRPTPATASACTRPTTRCRSTACRRPTRRTASSAGSRRSAPARRPSPTSCATGCSAASATGVSRSRSSTTPTASRTRCPESMLPVELPDITDFEPHILADDDTALPEPPLARADDWVHVELDLGDGPQRVPPRDQHHAAVGRVVLVLPALPRSHERRRASSIPRSSATGWVGTGAPAAGGVDLYVGGAEHAVLHLLYARFWHKVLFDLGHVSTPEPFHRLFNQGTITAAAFTDERGAYVEASEVEERDGSWFHDGVEVMRHDGKMGKSLKNAVAPDDIYRDYGADTLRLYEMFMGPLDASRPWSTQDIVGVHKFLQRFWRNVVDEDTGELHVTDVPADDETRRLLHRTIDAVGARHGRARVQHRHRRADGAEQPADPRRAGGGSAPREVVRAMVLMLAPLTPHVAEELWERLGETGLARRSPTSRCADPALLVDDTVEIPVQINGKVRARVTVATGASEAEHEAAARSDPKVAELLAGATVRKVVVVPGRMVNFVLA